MSWYAFIHLPTNIVVGVKYFTTTPNANPNLVELQEDELVDKGWIYAENETPRFKQPLSFFSWTAYQFLLRFTAEERAAFRAAALTDPNVADFQQLAQAAQEIINTDPMTMAGMDYLVSVGLLTESRKNEILGIESN